MKKKYIAPLCKAVVAYPENSYAITATSGDGVIDETWAKGEKDWEEEDQSYMTVDYNIWDEEW